MPVHPNQTRPRLIAALAGVLLVGCGLLALRPWSRPTPASHGGNTSLDDDARRFLEIDASLTARVDSDFRSERESEGLRNGIVEFWDRLNRDPQQAFATDLQPRSITLASPVAGNTLRSWDSARWTQQLKTWTAEGWRFQRSRWFVEGFSRQSNHFNVDVRFEILVDRAAPQMARARFRGRAHFSTTASDPPDNVPWHGRDVRVDEFESQWGEGSPRFETAFEASIPIPPHSLFTDPLLALSSPEGIDLLLVGAATWYRHRNNQWVIEPLPGLLPEPIRAAAIADWNRDGSPDLLVAGSTDIRWLRGPRWEGPGEVLWKSPERLPHPQSLAVADFDGDGDLDLFLGQYKVPYQGGQFPTPWYDAADGFPSHLLRNDGPKGLIDVTRDAGLGAKSRRRIYSASFVDWDEDGRMDLVWASDFAGLDLFRNAGTGRFEDATGRLGGNRFAFGMGHLTGDFDGDGRTDIFLVGMDSPVAARLDRAGEWDRRWDLDPGMRRAMTYGNRLLKGTADGFEPAPRGDSLARGGWAWAATALDVENDGNLDFHLTNGHETRASVRDYEEEFWTRDLHAAGSTNDRVALLLFRNAAGRRAAAQASYGGWQHSALFRGAGAGAWSESAWIDGTAIPADTRNAVAMDYDLDGRMDLAVTTLEGWPVVRQRLIILHNRTPSPGNWIGLHFDDHCGLGTRVRVKAGGLTAERRIHAGESHRSQTCGSVHFGLGVHQRIDSVELLPPGTTQWRRIEPTPPINRWSVLHGYPGTKPLEAK